MTICDYEFTPWTLGDSLVLASEAEWNKPLGWNLLARVAQPKSRPRVLVTDDPFKDYDGPIISTQGRTLYKSRTGGLLDSGPSQFSSLLTMSDVLARLFAMTEQCRNLDFIFETANPGNVRSKWQDAGMPDQHATHPADESWGYRRDNVFLSVPVDDQETADKRIPELLNCRDLASILMISYTGVGPLDLSHLANMAGEQYGLRDKVLDLVEIRGEVGPSARPCNIEYVRAVIRQCKEAGVPCWVESDDCLDEFRPRQLPEASQ